MGNQSIDKMHISGARTATKSGELESTSGLYSSNAIII